MKTQLCILSIMMFLLSACDTPPANNNTMTTPRSATPAATTTPAASPSVTKDGDYNGTGAVTKINMEIGSVEMDHDDIPGLMPPMRMEFYVTDKKMLDGLKVGDRVDFVLRYKDRTETIVKISKAK